MKQIQYCQSLIFKTLLMKSLNSTDGQFTQELTAQIQSTVCQPLEITQEVPAQFQDVEKTVSAIYRMGIREIEKVFLTSPVSK